MDYVYFDCNFILQSKEKKWKYDWWKQENCMY